MKIFLKIWKLKMLLLYALRDISGEGTFLLRFFKISYNSLDVGNYFINLLCKFHEM